MVFPAPTARPPTNRLEPTSGISVRQSGPAPIGVGVADAELVARILKEDVWAKEAFYRKHVDQAHRVALHVVKNQHDAEDVVQEAFVHALRDMSRLRAPNHARAWFMRIVVHRAYRRLRRRKWLTYFGFIQQEETVFEARSTTASPETQAELSLIESVLGSVPVRVKTAWVLRYVEGCTLPEVAEIAECSLATVKRRIKSVNDRLGKHLDVPADTECNDEGGVS